MSSSFPVTCDNLFLIFRLTFLCTLKLIFYSSYNTFFKCVNWLQDGEFLEIRETSLFHNQLTHWKICRFNIILRNLVEYYLPRNLDSPIERNIKYHFLYTYIYFFNECKEMHQFDEFLVIITILNLTDSYHSNEH